MEDVSLGFFLKELREKRGIKLEEISRETKILKKVLEAIENNEFSSIPEVYLKGIVGKYIRILKLQEEEAKEIFTRLNEFLEKNSFRKKEERKGKIFTREKYYQGGIIWLVFLPIIFYLIYEISLFTMPAKIFFDNLPSTVYEENYLLKGRVIRAKEIFLNGKEIYFDKKGFFEKNIVLQEGVNNIELKILNPLGKETVQTITLIYQKK
ncbi:MAG: helix-turn-helix domain-containing protein [Minisyncoccia bacterium]